MIELRYIGRKAWAIDPVGGSGVIWDGKGDVQGVSVNAARKILKHPDEWELANPEDASRLEVNTAHQTVDEDGKNVEIDDADLKKPFEKMSKAELKVYAKLRFGRDLSMSASRATLADQVEEFEKTLNTVNQAVPQSELAGATPGADTPAEPAAAPVADPVVDPTIAPQ